MRKNGLRIAALSALSVHVSHDFLFVGCIGLEVLSSFFWGLIVLWGVPHLLQLGDSRLWPTGSTPVRLGQPMRKIEI
jgi:hypothetical protein